MRAVGDVFTMRLTRGGIRDNHVVDFEEGRRIAWRPAVQGKSPPGHLWVWELEPLGPSRTLVTHTYDWTELTDRSRIPRAQATTAVKLQASLDRLATIAEKPQPEQRLTIPRAATILTAPPVEGVHHPSIPHPIVLRAFTQVGSGPETPDVPYCIQLRVWPAGFLCGCSVR